MKRFITMLLAGVLVLALVGCGSSTREIVKLTLSTEDSEAILAAAGIMLPDVEDTAAAGSTITWFSYYDDFHNYSTDEIVNTGYWTFTNKYGCEVEWIECMWDTRFDSLATLVLASNSPDFYPGDSNTFPIRALKGMFQPVDDYVDYDDPLWQGEKEYVYNYFSIKGRAYILCYDNSFGNVVAYNRRVVEQMGYDDPAELYYNDQWTWDVFYDMCVDFSDPDEDRYALDGWYFFSGLYYSSGTTVIIYNTETQRYESNVDDPRLERASQVLYDLSKNDCVYPWWNDWSLRNGVEGGGINEGLALFYIGATYVFTGPVSEMSPIWGDIMAGELMFAPLPRDPNGDGNYYTESNPCGYCIVKNAENPEGVALLAACDRFKVLDPTVISVDEMQLKSIYLWTDEMLEMYDICYELATSGDNVLVAYYEGLGDKLNDTVNYYMNDSHYEDAKTWAQLKEAYNEMLDYYIADLNSQLDAFDPDAEI